MPLGLDLALLEAIAITIMGAWLIVVGGGFVLRSEGDRASSILLAIAGVYAILWQEPAILGIQPDEFLHVGLAQPVFLFFLSGSIFLWAYWLFQQHVEELEDVTDALESSLTLERTLLDIISHDLRSPLTVARNRLAALTDHGSGPREAAAIRRSLDRAERIIEDSVLFSELATEGQVEFEDLDMRLLAERAVENLRPHAEARDVDVELEAPARVPARVSPIVQHAIENLLDNAIKFTPEGGAVRVVLTVGDDTVAFQVSDQGPGIDPENIEDLFERFERGDCAPAEGVGLGLSIVRSIVDVHDGKIDVETDGHGTTIAVELPCRPPDEGGRVLSATERIGALAGGGR